MSSKFPLKMKDTSQHTERIHQMPICIYPDIMDKYRSTSRPITVKFHYLEENSLQAFKSQRTEIKIILDFSTQLETRQCSNMFKILKETYFPPRLLQNIKYDRHAGSQKIYLHTYFLQKLPKDMLQKRVSNQSNEKQKTQKTDEHRREVNANPQFTKHQRVEPHSMTSDSWRVALIKTWASIALFNLRNSRLREAQLKLSGGWCS